MSWNFDISAAPRDRQILMRTTRDGDKVFVTNWLEPTKHCPNGRFNGFSENSKSLLAWCEIPALDNQPETATGETGMVLGTGRERPLSIGLHTDEGPEARFETDSLHQSHADAIAQVTCERCQGNGEIVTDWERYKHPREGDVGDEAVAECSDCGGEGIIDAFPTDAVSPIAHSKANTSREATTAVETVSAQRGVAAFESGCPALIDDVGGQ